MRCISSTVMVTPISVERRRGRDCPGITDTSIHIVLHPTPSRAALLAGFSRIFCLPSSSKKKPYFIPQQSPATKETPPRAGFFFPLRPAALPTLSLVHVRRRLDVVGERLDVNVEPLLDLVEHLGVILGGHKGDGEALGAEASCTTHLKAEYTNQIINQLFRQLFSQRNRRGGGDRDSKQHSTREGRRGMSCQTGEVER